MSLSRPTIHVGASRAELGAARRCLVFAVAGVHYAIDLARISRVVALPHPSAFVVVQEAGCALLDLRALFGLPPAAAQRRAVLVLKNPGGSAALVVDEVARLVSLTAPDLHALPAVYAGAEREWFEGLARTPEGILVVVRPAGILCAGCPDRSPGSAALAVAGGK
jgi:chemotaxis signal transduction protein